MSRTTIISLMISAVALFGSGAYVFAHSTHIDIDSINSEIELKQQSIDQLNRQIESYREKIVEKQQQEATLYGELDLLENRIAKAELDMVTTEAEIDLVNAEIKLVEDQIHTLEDQISDQREMVAEILREIHIEDNTLPLQLLFGTESFSEFFDALEQLEAVSTDLKTAVDQARATKDTLLTVHEQEELKKDQLEGLSSSLKQEQLRLESTVGAKSVLLTQTQSSEAQFQALLRELRAEQSYVNQQIANLQREIERKLDASDELGDSSLLSWPVDPTIRGISADYHDPTYPFRHLFEHSGVDLPGPVGTPIRAAAPGYVAWTRTGRMYGNYIMIIHSDGLATLYTHLSTMNVSPDQFVDRGDIIGGMGSTGFSTGPHLHFEVRKNGIPTNPNDYLVSY